MSEVWLTIGVLALVTAVIRASGPVLLGGRELPGPLRDVVVLLAPALLAALVVTQTFGDPDGRELELDPRTGGVAAAALVLAMRRSALLAIAVATAVTALGRALL